ncbi:MAG: transglutaminase-like domain-containing protein, partial [Anaerolineae bacterium]
MPNTPTVARVAQQIADGATTERTKAVALHDYVRDRVKFGFNKYFDAGDLDYILACSVGHCNPKTRLMAALFQAAGLESAQHF